MNSKRKWLGLLAVSILAALTACGGGGGGGNVAGGGAAPAPALPVVVSTWESVSAGDSHTVAKRSDGTLWAWGANFDGQLGDGTLATRSVPTQIGSATNWAAVSAGDAHTLATRSDGTLWAWGRNVEGRLGDGTTVAKSVPTQIGTATNWVSVSAGDYHSLATRSTGARGALLGQPETLWAWGYNVYGQLGDGTTVDKSVPT